MEVLVAGPTLHEVELLVAAYTADAGRPTEDGRIFEGPGPAPIWAGDADYVDDGDLPLSAYQWSVAVLDRRDEILETEGRRLYEHLAATTDWSLLLLDNVSRVRAVRRGSVAV